MGVRGGASGRSLSRTTAPPVSSAFTLAGWGYYYNAGNSSGYRYFAGSENTSGGNYCLIGWENGAFHITVDGTAYIATATNPPTSTWFYWFLSRSGNTFTFGWKTTGSWVTNTVTATPSWTPNLLILLNDSYDEWTDAAVERVRAWTAALTTTELDGELASATPVRTSGLWFNVALTTTTDLSDTTGNSRSLTANGTLSTVTGPSFGGGVTATAAATIGGITAAGAASIAVNVASAATIGRITAAGSATLGSLPGVTAAGTAIIGAVQAAAAVSVGVNAASVATLRTSAAGAASVGVTASAAATIGAVQAAGKAYRLVGATAGGVVTASGRYFRTSNAGSIVLAGFHTWTDISDTGSTYPPAAFDWASYLDALVAKGCNYTKLWMMESARDWGDASPLYFAPLPWARTGPGNANDGQPKFDLTKYDSAWFERLRGRAIEAGNRGVCVCVQLFQGWHVESKGLSYNPWTYHPFNAANNINGVNGDANADGKGLETRSTTSTAIFNLQKSYVDQVIAAVGDLDNVIYEISNEDHNDSWDWQVALMGYIRTVESGRSKQHLVGITVCWPTSNNSQLAASAADWVSYADTDTTPDANTSGPISAYDTDHNPNLFVTDRAWVWRALTRGHGGLWLMDHWAGETYGTDYRDNAAWNLLRANLGYALTYAARLDLANATPQGGLSSTGYCLAKTSGRYQLLAYQDNSGAFTINLTSLAGTFTLEWLRVQTGATQSGGTVAGNATRTLTPPWAGEDAVALLELAGYYASGAATIGGITAAGAASAAINAAAQAAVGAVTVAAAGSVSMRGDGAAGVGAVSALGAASVTANAAAQAVAGTVSVVAVASVAVAAAGAAPIGGVVALGAAVVAVSAVGAATTGAVTASGYGSAGVVVVAGNGSAALGAIAAGGAASVAVNAIGAAAIVVTAVGSAAVGVNAAGSATVSAAAAAGVASVAVDGAGQATVGAITATGYAGSGTVGNGAAVLGSIVATGSGSIAVAGAGLGTVGGLAVAGAASVPAAGAVAVQVGVVAAAGAASAPVSGSGAATLGAIAASGSGALTALPNLQGYGAATVGGIIAVGTVVVAWVAVMGRVTGPGGSGAVSGPGVKAKV